ncbi:type II toxin-antitoxin system VapC family toxin [Neisseriaceae bacterium B1]
MYLLDTNIISEIRKIGQGKANSGVATWANQTSSSDMYMSCITLLELEKGIFGIECKDVAQGKILRTWLENQVKPAFGQRILPIDTAIALRCVQMHVPQPKSITDSLIAATALQHDLIVVTRNIADFAHMGARLLNPFTE